MAHRLLVFGLLLACAGLAAADTKSDIKSRTSQAYDAYDGFEYEEARKQLNSALTLAKKQRLENTPEVARVHLALGIVYFGGLKDEESAKLAFLSAVQIDPTVEIDPAYRTPAMAKLLAEAREEAKAIANGAGGTPPPDVQPDDPAPALGDCPKGSEIVHAPVDTIERGSDLVMRAQVGPGAKADAVSLMVRGAGAADYERVRMEQDGCVWSARLPEAVTQGDIMHYYFEARRDGEPVARAGSASLPNLVEIIGGRRRRGDDRSSGGAAAVGTSKRFFIGLGYLFGGAIGRGVTEQGDPIEFGLTTSFAALRPEFSFAIGRRGRLGLAARIGIPVKANITPHSTAFPAGFLRYHHHLRDDRNGLEVNVMLGGGIVGSELAGKIRGDQDILNTGPLLAGAGLAYAIAISPSVALEISGDAILGVAPSAKFGNAFVTTTVHFDLGVSLRIGI